MGVGEGSGAGRLAPSRTIANSLKLEHLEQSNVLSVSMFVEMARQHPPSHPPLKHHQPTKTCWLYSAMSVDPK